MSEFPKRYIIKGQVVNGQSHTVEGGMSPRFDKCYFHIQFFSDENQTTEVKPASGTVKLQLSPDGSNFYDLNVGGTIDVATMYDPDYTLPNAEQPASDGKITMSGFPTSADIYFKATFERY